MHTATATATYCNEISKLRIATISAVIYSWIIVASICGSNTALANNGNIASIR